VPWCGGSEYFLDSISTLCDMEVYAVGDFVYKADDICRMLYIIQSGNVAILDSDAAPDQHVHVSPLWSLLERAVLAGGPTAGALVPLAWQSDDIRGKGAALGQLEFLFDFRWVEGSVPRSRSDSG
jgi:hypothetical protein